MIELLTVIAIIAVLSAVAVPGFQTVLLNQRLATASQAFVAALGLARNEAIRLAAPASVVAPSAGGWNSGWNVVTFDSALSAQTGTAQGAALPPRVLRRFDALPSGIAVDRRLGDGFAQGVHFDGNGFSRRAGNGGFGAGCLTFKADTGRRASVVISASGRARICDPDRPGECGSGVCGQGASESGGN